MLPKYLSKLYQFTLYLWYIKGPVYPHIHHHLVALNFLIFVDRVGVKQYLVVLISIYLLVNEVEYIFTCFLAIYGSVFVKCLFMSFAHFSTDLSFSYFKIKSFIWILIFCQLFMSQILSASFCIQQTCWILVNSNNL